MFHARTAAILALAGLTACAALDPPPQCPPPPLPSPPPSGSGALGLNVSLTLPDAPRVNALSPVTSGTAAGLPGLVEISGASAEDLRRAFAAAAQAPDDDAKFWALVGLLPKDGANVVLEGDILVSTDELRRHLLTLREASATMGDGTGKSRAPSSLKIHQWGGTPFYWRSPKDRKLTYSIDRSSFTGDNAEERYNVVRGSFEKACKEWEDLCPRCNISFTHKTDLDAQPSTLPGDNVTFVVRYKDVRGVYIAAAFFPYDSADTRYINVDPSYFSTPYDRVGVFRHELGHVLGYRHEHIDGQSGCAAERRQEDTQWTPLTPYDPHSVMHYFCATGGSLALSFTDLDREGHSLLYEKGQWQAASTPSTPAVLPPAAPPTTPTAPTTATPAAPPPAVPAVPSPADATAAPQAAPPAPPATPPL